MKKILTIIMFFLMVAPLSLPAQRQSRAERRAEAEAQRLDRLKKMIDDRNFVFTATAYETTYGGLKRAAARGTVKLYPGWTDFAIPGFNAENITRGTYTVIENPDNWVVMFTAKALGLDGDRAYDGTSVNFTFKFTIERTGKAVLEVTTDFNDRKYPHIYRGSISSNDNSNG